jgi:hypothetical protein
VVVLVVLSGCGGSGRTEYGFPTVVVGRVVEESRRDVSGIEFEREPGECSRVGGSIDSVELSVTCGDEQADPVRTGPDGQFEIAIDPECEPHLLRVEIHSEGFAGIVFSFGDLLDASSPDAWNEPWCVRLVADPGCPATGPSEAQR